MDLETCSTHYQVLRVKEDCSASEIRRAYLQLAVEFHPDRVGDDAPTNATFLAIQAAWEALRSEDLRAEYDRQLKAERAKAKAPLHDEIDLDDMDFDEETEVYLYPCRCGDRYRVLIKDLEAGYHVFSCSGCSFSIHVTYQEITENPSP
eukprot:TRINITY_DN10339_c0_g1_i1.p1 TRINITY_DN10339_c0_g1~~TRINITY_DN10339_c0_g1_i1.p1  ORF type:complete len:149 (+),score=30.15 TRINITY_DN10339_c0_g1_i1:71-517(+)